jgi:hypothetical protein
MHTSPSSGDLSNQSISYEDPLGTSRSAESSLDSIESEIYSKKKKDADEVGVVTIGEVRISYNFTRRKFSLVPHSMYFETRACFYLQ